VPVRVFDVGLVWQRGGVSYWVIRTTLYQVALKPDSRWDGRASDGLHLSVASKGAVVLGGEEGRNHLFMLSMV
jgi:hypothetical protein